MNAEKITIASTEIVSMSAGSCRKMLARAATRITTAPMNRNFCMPDRSRLIVVARVAMVPNTTAVPPKAIMTSCEPLLMPRTKPSRRDSMTPMKKVNNNSRPTPRELSLFFSMANINPKAPTKKMMADMPGLVAMTWLRPVYIPTAAPRTVGIKESASSQ